MTTPPTSISGLLHRFFHELRRVGYSLGVGEYEVMLQALEGGFGLERDRAQLYRLCKMLWLKSEWEEAEFRLLFDRVVGQTTNFLQAYNRQSAQGETSLSSERIEPRKPEPVQPPTSPDSEDHSQDPSPSPSPEPMAQETQPPEPIETPDSDSFDESQFIRTQIQTPSPAQENSPSSSFRFSVSRDYLPVTRRRMQQQWCYLRRKRREGPATELDLPATVRQAVSQPYLVSPALQPARKETTRLILLLDVQGSMVAFEALGERLRETAQRSGYLKAVEVYYFHDAPQEYLFTDPNLLDFLPIKEVLNPHSRKHTVMLLFSDCGAARGMLSAGIDFNRTLRTLEFLETKAQATARRAVWLNPLPAYRWIGTTAMEVAKAVPMFEAGSRGMFKAMQYLNGKPVAGITT